jgi:hypothetical protein
MQYIRLQFPDDAEGAQGRCGVAKPDMALHGRAPDAEGKLRAHLGKQPFLVRAARGGIADQADRVAGCRLGVGQVADMAENAANR